MPVHDWTRVDMGIFHAFRLSWITELAKILNSKILPCDHYAMLEQHEAGSNSSVWRLSGALCDNSDESLITHKGGSIHPPLTQPIAETDMEFYRRKQTPLVVRHASGDRVVAMIEIVSPGNKSTRNALRAFVEKAAKLLDERVHLLIIDLFPPGRRDPQGLHGEIWQEIAGQEYSLPAGRPLTLAAYETDLTVRAYVNHFAVGDSLPEMPLFLEPGGCVQAPLDETYHAAFKAMPQRWKRVLE